MRLIAGLAIVFLSTIPARADCAAEAIAARDKVWTSGPLRFDSREWSKNFSYHTCGVLDPGKAEHDQICPGEPPDWQKERITVGRQFWTNDGLGWTGPGLSLGRTDQVDHRGKLPERANPSDFHTISCPGIANVDGRELIKYEFVTADKNQPVQRLFVDPVSGLAVRFERKGPSEQNISGITTYLYEELKIEPPVVDLAQRRATSLQRYAEAVQHSDPACRDKILSIIARGRERPFGYRITSNIAGFLGYEGTFTPPNSIYVWADGAPYHGGGEEFRGTVEDRPEDDDLTARTRGGITLGERVFASLVPIPSEIGGTRCIGRVVSDRRDYEVFEYDLYWNDGTAKVMGEQRRMLVEPKTQLPVRTEISGAFQPTLETRNYNPSP